MGMFLRIVPASDALTILIAYRVLFHIVNLKGNMPSISMGHLGVLSGKRSPLVAIMPMQLVVSMGLEMQHTISGCPLACCHLTQFVSLDVFQIRPF